MTRSALIAKVIAYSIAYVSAIIFTVFALDMAIESAGLGHGNYRYAIMFFPLELILIYFFPPLGIVLACIHYPLLVFLFQRARGAATRIGYVVFVVIMHSFTPIYLLLDHQGKGGRDRALGLSAVQDVAMGGEGTAAHRPG